MAVPPIIFPSNSILHSLFSNHHSFFYLRTFRIHLQHELNSTRTNKRRSYSRSAVSSSHSNAKILKSNRRSRFGQRLSPYDSDNENESIHDHHDDDEDDWLSDDPGPGFDDDKLRRKSQAAINGNGGSMFSRTGRKKKIINENGKVMLDRNNYIGKDKDPGKSSKNIDAYWRK